MKVWVEIKVRRLLAGRQARAILTFVRTTRWLPSFLGLVGLVVVGGGSANVASAQASALGNPYAPGSGAAASVAPTSTTPPTSIAPVTPPAYSDVSVPAPPSPPGVYAAPRGAVVADSPDVHIGTSIATRLRALDADLQILSARGGGNIFDGVLMLVSAAATAVWAVVLDTSGPRGTTSYAAIYLYTYAGASATRAILSFALMTNPSAPAIRYSHMPMGSVGEVRERLQYGELQLDALADQARLSRILDGSINLAVGLAVIPAYLGPNNFEVRNTADWFVLVLAGISTVMGVVTLVSTTEAERRQAAYHDLRDRVLATPEGMSDEDALDALSEPAASTVSVAPIVSLGPTGGFAGATVTF